MSVTRPLAAGIITALVIAGGLLRADSDVTDSDVVAPEQATEPTRAEQSETDQAIIVPVSVSPEEGRGPAAIEIGNHIGKVAQLVNPSVVHIQSERSGRGGGSIEETGSGVIMQMSGQGEFVVTNRHVVQGARMEDIKIQLNDGRLAEPVNKLEDPETDICVLKLSASNLSPARWGDSDSLDIGHMVLAMGSPFGLSKSITLGIISAKGRRALNLGADRDMLNQDFLQTDAAINPGNSGGPLIDMYGRVVGINTAIASSSGGNEGIGFSIPSNLVQRIVHQLLTHGRVRRAYLGVLLDDNFDIDKARRYSLDRSRGARVVTVYPDTPAAQAGLQTDDLILNFDGRDIEDENHLIHLVSMTEINRTVRLLILRDGRRRTVQVRLTDRNQLDDQSALPPSQRFAPGEDVRIEPAGLKLHRLDENLAPQLGLARSSRGLVVMSCRMTDDADSLRLYDVIEEAARTPVHSVSQLTDLLDEHPGGPLLLKVRRNVDGHELQRLILWHPPQ